MHVITHGRVPKEHIQCSYIAWLMGALMESGKSGAQDQEEVCTDSSTNNVQDINNKSSKVVHCLKYNKGTCLRTRDHE